MTAVTVIRRQLMLGLTERGVLNSRSPIIIPFLLNLCYLSVMPPKRQNNKPFEAAHPKKMPKSLSLANKKI